MSAQRTLVVGLGLAVAGAVLGALAGILVVAAVGIANGVSTRDFALLREPLAYLLGAIFGAPCGAILAPFAALTFLRHVPLWRLFATVTLGTVLGGVAASLAHASLGGILAAGAAGFLLAAGWLSHRTAQVRHVDQSAGG